MFCSNCGVKLNANDVFCTGCGTRIQTVVTQAPVQQRQNAVWVIIADKRLSLLNMITCHVVLYQDRLVLAHMSNELRKTIIAGIQKDLKEEKIGFFKSSAQMMVRWSEVHKKYYTMPISSILAEDPMNREIMYNDISQILFSGYDQGDDDEASSGGKLVISLVNGEKIKLTHKTDHSAQVKNILEKTFGYRLKYKK